MFSQLEPKPPIVNIMGPPKVGKDTLACMFPNPSIIQCEDSGDGIIAPKTPLLKSYSEITDALKWLATEKHDFKTAIFDSTDWAEQHIVKQVCLENNVSNIEKIPYGKGWIFAKDLWMELINAAKYLRDQREMTFIWISHTEIKRYENPETEPYDRYQMKLNKTASDLIMESSDMILFINYFVGTTKSKTGFGNERVRAIGSGERVIYTEERPAFKAGNRFGLPSEIPFDLEGNCLNVIANHVPYYKKIITAQKGV